MRFVPNRGQWDERVRFALAGASTAAWLHDDGWTMRIERRADDPFDGVVGGVLRMRFVAPRPSVELTGVGGLGGPAHFLRGDDPLRFARGVIGFEQVRYAGLYEGIDLLLRRPEDPGLGALFQYDLLLASGAAIDGIEIRCEGSDEIALESDGSLRIVMGLGDGGRIAIRHRPPESWTLDPSGRRTPIRVRFRRTSSDSFGFVADGWSGIEPLVIDPGFVWATYLGGGSSDNVHAVRRAPDGGIVVAGWAGSSDFPVTPGAFATRGGQDAFVAKLTADGRALVWSTFLGGGGGEEARALAVDALGNVVVGGWTGSPDFPTTPNAYQRPYYGGSLLSNIGDGFVAKLTADGSALLFSTLLGRVGDDFVQAVHDDGRGTVTVAGYTDSEAFPTTAGVVQPNFRSASVLVPDGFVARLTNNGSGLAWSTLFGGAAQDMIFDMHVDAAGGVTVAGLTASEDLTTSVGAYQTALHGVWSGFVTRFAPDAQSLTFSTFFGGEDFDQVRGLTVDPFGETVIVGRTSSAAPFPSSDGGYQRRFGGDEDGFVARLSADGRRLRAGTLLGGADDDSCEAVTVAANGDVLVVGTTSGAGFPTTANAAQPVFGGGISDGLVARFDAELRFLRYASFVGGRDKDVLVAIASMQGDDLVAGGWTWSTDVPLPAAGFQSVHAGSSDGLIVRVGAAPDLATPGEFAITSAPGVVTFQPGAATVGVAVRLRNTGSRAVELLRVDVLVNGTGDVGRELSGVRLFEDRGSPGVLDAGDVLLSGPTPIVGAQRFQALPVAGRTLVPGERVALLVVVDAGPHCEVGAEFAVALPFLHAIEVRDVSTGRRVTLAGDLPGSWPILACGERRPFAGDVDGDGRATCRDLRSVARRIGFPAPPHEDPDRDGFFSSRDIDLMLARLLELPVVVGVSEPLERGSAWTVSGFGFVRGAAAAIGGRALAQIHGDDRQLVFAVPENLDPGLLEVSLTLGPRDLFRSTLEIR